jgi:di/tricarboxylate transporter
VTPAFASLLALLAAIVVSCTSRLNVGLAAIAMAWLVGLYAGIDPTTVLAGFPSALFVTLAGVTLLFSLAEQNGTIGVLAHRLVSAAGDRTRLLPLLIFAIACAIATVGPGAIAAVALVAPLAMGIGRRAGIAPFVIALMVANGANAGNLSPLSAVGVIANTRMASIGLGGHEWKVWAANFIAHALVTVIGYAMFARALGPAKAGHFEPGARARATTDPVAMPARNPLSRAQWFTIAVISAWIAAVMIVKAPIGLAAFAAAVVLIVFHAVDEGSAVARMPWSAILMVSGVTMLVALVEKTGGMELFTALLARIATPATVNGVIGFVTGVISSYSSTSGVVLPTFLPMSARLVEQVGGGDPLAVALSINVGGSLVDVSPLSTLGALCVAAVLDPQEGRDLFRKLLLWGLSMSVVGALLCQVFAGPFARL